MSSHNETSVRLLEPPAMVANRLFDVLRPATLTAKQRRAVAEAIAALLVADKSPDAGECREMVRRLALIRAHVDASTDAEFWELRSVLDTVRKLTEADHASG